MSKRKQRSTQIRKRIEKKQREQEKAKKRAAKASGADGANQILLGVQLPRERVEACHAALADLEARLTRESVRGWTASDLQGEHGLSWFKTVLAETMEGSAEGPRVQLQFFEGAKSPLLERLGALEIAASGLRVQWDEAGFDELVRAVSQAEELADDEDEDEDEAESSGDDTAASGDETPASDEPAAETP